MEKAGIIKNGIPVVIGETLPETRPIFEALAQENHSPVTYAEEDDEVVSAEQMSDGSGIYYKTAHLGEFKGQLCGTYQIRNTRTILCAAKALAKMGYLCEPTAQQTWIIIQKEVKDAFLHVTEMTGLKGRWQTMRTSPTVICDIGHNPAAWEYLSKQLNALEGGQLHIVFGLVSDKDVYGIMSLMPKNAIYYFTKPGTSRALPEQSLQIFGQQFGLAGECYATVKEAYHTAIRAAENNDFIFVGGSNYVVAEFLKTRD